MTSLIAASVTFVGLHFLLSHPLRRPLVGAIGEGPFLGIYSVAALGSFAWMVLAYRAIGPQPFAHAASEAGWIAATIVMWFASVLFAGSLFGNPALPNPKSAPTIGEPAGVFHVTRHPMMWGFALWALVHGYLVSTPRDHVVSAAILVLALGGAWGQDRKKEALVPIWRDWEAKTSFFPFGRQLTGQGGLTLGGARALLLGTLLWLGATWAHVPLGGAMAAGIWRWLS